MNSEMLKKLSGNILFLEVLLGAIWLTIVFIVNPRGEFPLNDDWAYSKSVLHLVNTGKFILIDWPAMSLIALIYWGGLFCYFFGFSFTVLRISTLILGFIGAIILFRLISKTTQNPFIAFIGALLIIINPLYVSLSFSFMTDVPFTVLCILSFYSFFYFFKHEKIIALIFAVLFSVLATLTRQMGILVPFSFAIIYLITSKISIRVLINAIVPFAIAISALLYYNHWLTVTDRMTYAYKSYGSIKVILMQFKQPFAVTLEFLFSRVGAALFYCAIFLLPLLILILPTVLKKQIPLKRAWPVLISAIFMLVYFLYFKSRIFSPLTGNVLYNLGIGPKLLKDTYLLNLHVTPFLDSSFWLVVSIIGLISMFFLILALSDTLITLIQKLIKREMDLKWTTISFMYVVSFIYLGYLVFSYFFDRYFVFLVPTIIFILLTSYVDNIDLKHKWTLPVSGIVFLFIAWFSISSTHDYLSWNRARWEALNYLTVDKQISPKSIDGGFEFNLWNETGSFKPVDDSISWWCVNDDEYIISFGNIAKYKTLKKFQYSTMLPCKDNNIYILQRNITVPEIISCDFEQFSEDSSRFVSSNAIYQIPANNFASTEKSHSGKYSVKLSPTNPYGVAFLLKNVLPGELYDIRIWKLGEDNDIVILASGGKDPNFTYSSSKAVVKADNGWEQISLRFYAPTDVKKGISIVCWNTKQNQVYLDDLTIKVVHLD